MKGATNVYLNKEAASHFEQSTFIPGCAFYAMADFLDEVCNLSSCEKLNILDVGSGTGRTILHILLRFKELGLNFHADCFDISPNMYHEFAKNLECKPALQSCVHLLLHDADDALPDQMFPSEYDLLSIVAVLHYLNDWRQFMQEAANKLASGGFLMLAEVIGWYRLLDGRFDETATEDELSVTFWETYFQEREKYGNWDPEVQFAHLSPVRAFCEENLNMTPVAKHDFYWNSQIAWQDVLSWIEIGTASSLGSNISQDSDRTRLRDTMSLFLKRGDVPLNQSFPIRWGFRLTVHQRGE